MSEELTPTPSVVTRVKGRVAAFKEDHPKLIEFAEKAGIEIALAGVAVCASYGFKQALKPRTQVVYRPMIRKSDIDAYEENPEDFEYSPDVV